MSHTPNPSKPSTDVGDIPLESDVLPKHYYAAPQYFYQDYEVFEQRPRQLLCIYAAHGHYKPVEFVHPPLTAEEERAVLARAESVWVHDRFVSGQEFASLVRQATKTMRYQITKDNTEANRNDVEVKVSNSEKPIAMSHQDYFDMKYNPTQFARSRAGRQGSQFSGVF